MCFFTACIVNAYEALHANGYVYRDMKPANVLIKENGYAVLIDFGLAAKLNTALKGKCGERLFDALNALLMPKPEYVAMRLKKAMMASDER